MRMTIDIPDSLYMKLRAEAAREGSTVREVIVRLVRQEVEPANRVLAPLVRAKEKRKLDLTNAEINEILY